MGSSFLEHINFTVSNPEKSAELLCTLFDWRIRWQGDAIHGGRTVHVGSDKSYLALYSKGNSDSAKISTTKTSTYDASGGLNHLGIVVDDLDDVEARVRKAGLEPHSHADYEPGRRFYFHDGDDIEFEVVSYQTSGRSAVT